MRAVRRFAFHPKTLVQATTASLREVAALRNVFFIAFFPSGFVTLFYSFWEETQQTTTKKKYISSNIHVNKKKVIWLFKKLEIYERASFCVSSALFIYLKGCTLYQFTLPHSLRHRLQHSEVKRINYFFLLLLFIK